MQDFQLLTPDAETFARVWKRVMPDESLSQIVVHAPGEVGGKPRAAAPEEGRGEQELLAAALGLLDEGLGCINSLLRRNQGVWPLADSLSRSAAQLRPMWYLLTGEGWQGRRVKYLDKSTAESLREQYLREIHFSQLCRRGVEGEGDALEEVLRELEEASRRRRRTIRQLLTRMGVGRA